MELQEYFKNILDEVHKTYSIATLAREKNLDPENKVEIPLASSLAEKAIGLISTIYPQLDNTIVKRILELEQEYGSLDICVSFKIAEEIAEEKFCKFKNRLEAIDAGIRVGFAYNTLGVVSSPIEGFTGLKLEKTNDGNDYFKVYFSGPIRSAGTTASCLVLMLIDYLREHFGYAKYDPTEEEVKRYVTENYDYHTRVTNLQYLPTEEEIVFLAKNLPIQIAGEPTEDREVSNYKDLKRVESNFIRGGMCLIFSEGLAQKAQKGFRLLKGAKEKGFITSGWNFLEQYIELHKKREAGKGEVKATYIKDLVAGRPVFGHPSMSGGFRFRYGKSRTNGFSATSISPATMGITDSFLSSGTQLKIEKPTKGCAITSCDELDGPIVKLKTGSVKKIDNYEEAKKIFKDVEEVIYLGDLLFSLGDLINRNYSLIKSGYVEEWWELELEKAIKLENKDQDKEKKIEEKIGRINKRKISFKEAKNISERFNIPLHPKFIYYWTQIQINEFISLLNWLNKSEIREEKLIFPYTKQDKEEFKESKRTLELLGIEHEVTTENVVIDEENTSAILFNLGIEIEKKEDEELISSMKLGQYIPEILKKLDENKEVLENINSFSKFKIKDKAGTFIGTRMGRPEKAKPRELIGSPHALFPVGEQGGKMRSFQAALERGQITAEFPIFYCEICGEETIYPICEFCGKKTKKQFYCKECGKLIETTECKIHGEDKGIPYRIKTINTERYFKNALKNSSLDQSPKIVKGVRGTSNTNHIPENLTKGILRAYYGIHVNKDGTIRYDATELPITHFKPKEIRTSVEKLKLLGYEKDIYNNELISEEQILEIFPQDIILPSCPDSKDEKADDVFLNISFFIDDLLSRFYGIEPFYKIRKKEEIVGNLAVCMAPHNCAGVIARIIGFSKVQGILASPYIHAAVRRDCDGDEVAVMMLLDVLLNFSRSFLPAHRGGTQDAPLVLNARINAGEVDDQILDLELAKYPLELYEMAEQGKHSSELKIETVKTRLKNGEDPFTHMAFTHDTKDFNNGVTNSLYKSIPTMQEKVNKQMHLAGIIRAVNTKDVARLIIERHFMRDIVGNFNKFTQQQFRCVHCNEKYRRPPLSGTCSKCKNGRIIFTISEGGIIKYLIPALDLAKKFDLSDYVKQNLDIVQKAIQSLFGKEEEKQQDLKKWFD